MSSAAREDYIAFVAAGAAVAERVAAAAAAAQDAQKAGDAVVDQVCLERQNIHQNANGEGSPGFPDVGEHTGIGVSQESERRGDVLKVSATQQSAM